MANVNQQEASEVEGMQSFLVFETLLSFNVIR